MIRKAFDDFKDFFGRDYIVVFVAIFTVLTIVILSSIDELIKSVNELWLYVGAISGSISVDKKSKIYKELGFRMACIDFVKLGNFEEK